MIDSVSSARRPIRSPTMPSTSPPTGRAAKPSQNTRYVSSCLSYGSIEAGKNCLPISVEKYP